MCRCNRLSFEIATTLGAWFSYGDPLGDRLSDCCVGGAVYLCHEEMMRCQKVAKTNRLDASKFAAVLNYGKTPEVRG